MLFEPINLTPPAKEPQPQASSIRTTIPVYQTWTPILSSKCAFSAEIFQQVMLNLIRNPNHNSGYLFRADILFDEQYHYCDDENNDDEHYYHDDDNIEKKYEKKTAEPVDEKDDEGVVVVSDGSSNNNNSSSSSIKPIPMEIQSFRRTRTIIRKLIPRNPQLDKVLLQTCHFYSSLTTTATTTIMSNQATATEEEEREDHHRRNIVLYLPHASSAEEIPYYHPAVRGIGFMHTPTQISIHYCYFSTPDLLNPALQPRLHRTALHLLQTLHKHGQGQAAGYIKRVHHDMILPQAAYQNTYTDLKIRHAKRLVENWAESTDAAKHVFEDLGIAAFLIELWRGMYNNDDDDDDDSNKNPFPGFVDIGCGNGVLVDILLREGWKGWGFDARQRKSWITFPREIQASLKELIFFPEPFVRRDTVSGEGGGGGEEVEGGEKYYHPGIFPPNTFLISNHADELTGWTPILAAMANHAPFLIIPCCSHDLSGAKFRAPPTTTRRRTSSSSGRRTTTTQTTIIAGKSSAYATLCDWVEDIAVDLGYHVEREALRIPSTRNTALVARKPVVVIDDVDDVDDVDDGGDENKKKKKDIMSVEDVLRKYAGDEDDLVAVGRKWVDRARKLRK